jgi:RimJ/RimL family protein N-acetyltransferase
LVLREQTPDDTDALAEIICDRETMTFYPDPFTRDDASAWIEKNMRLYESHGFGLWAMELRGTHEFVGQCGLTIQHVEGVPLVEVGWHVNRRHWRNGYASEAGAAALELGFGRFSLTKIISLILPENVPSAGVARKIGMEIEREADYKGLRHNVWATEAPR